MEKSEEVPSPVGLEVEVESRERAAIIAQGVASGRRAGEMRRRRWEQEGQVRERGRRVWEGSRGRVGCNKCC
jgi:hypothetical protein